MVKRVYASACKSMWYGAIILLPITSLPLVAQLVGSNSVAAPSGLLVGLLFVGWLIPAIIQRIRIPFQSLPLIFFVLFAFAVTAGSLFLSIPPYKDNEPLRSELTACITLLVGAAFFLITSTWIRNERQLDLTLKLINWGGCIVLLYSALQYILWSWLGNYPAWIDHFQTLISVGKLYSQRVTGFAFEPSWLAHQLNLVYLPFWLAATVRKTSVYRFRLLGISFENFLLGGGIVVLYLTLSRVGLVAFFCMLAVVFVGLNIRLIRWIKLKIWVGIEINEGGSHRKGMVIGRMVTWGVSLGLIILYLSVIGLTVYRLSQVDVRMEKVFQFDPNVEAPILHYANQLNFGERVVYWQTGWNIFNDHPWIGVGLGNAGYFFREALPPYGWYLTEVRRLMYHENTIFNIKSLWVRLLAETGIVGFILFFTWLSVLLYTAISLAKTTPRKTEGEHKYQTVGWAGIFVLTGLVLEGFSIDSFGLPYIWFSLGIVSAVFGLYFAKD